jgi:hypothetical protein
MSDLERDLRNALAQRASTSAGDVGDWQDLTVRLRKRDQRTQRLLATGLVLAVLAGPLAGFGVAQAIERDTTRNRITAAGPGDGNGDIATSEGLTWSEVGLRSSLAAIGGGTLEPLFRRTTDDGITVRAFRMAQDSSCTDDGWCAPPECIPNASISGQLNTDEAVGLAFGSTYPDDKTLLVTGAGGFGDRGEGSPSRWVIAQTSDDVATVRFEYAGATDEMEPEQGVAILAVPGEAGDTPGTVVALDGSGAELERTDVDAPPIESLADGTGSLAAVDLRGRVTVSPPGGPVLWTPATGEECAPRPPALPEPGEQPADPAAAKQQIEAAFATAYDGGPGDTPEKRAVVEDSGSLVGVMDQIRNGSFAEQVKNASGQVTEVVFVSPTEAAVRYDITVENSSSFTGRIGRAKLIDGVWKVARETVCEDIALASGTCPPRG